VERSSSKAFRTRLRDGALVLIRPVGPEDRDLLREGMAQLSDRSRYRRFMCPVRELSAAQLEQLTDIDHVDHMAWGAGEIVDGAAGRGLGIARYVRLAEEPQVAEAAVAVIDSFQGRGLGSALLAALTCSAAENGISTFRAFVLEENDPMLRMLVDLGATLMPEGGGVVRVEMPVPREIGDLPDTATGRVFKAVAREMVPPLAVRFLHAEVLAKAVRLFAELPHLLKDKDGEDGG
jgi:GNAT superfamily N-acetyltransferase